MAEEWQKQLEGGNLPAKTTISEQLLEEIGVAGSEAQSLKETLARNRITTWGSLLSLMTLTKVIEKCGNDEIHGGTIWNYVQDYKTKAASARERAAPRIVREHPLPIINRTLATMKKPTSIQLRTVDLGAHPLAKKCRDANVPAAPGYPNEAAMLFFGLGDGTMVSKDRIEHLANANSSNPVILFAPSGSGKTRLCLELWWKEFGMYVGAKTVGDKNPGSTALMDIAKLLPSFFRADPKYEWDQDHAVNEKPSFTAYANRRELAEFAVGCVIYAYLGVFRALGGAETLTPAKWLLIQLYPDHFLGADHFSSLAIELFKHCSPTFMGPSTIDLDWSVMRHWVVDEANLLSKEMPNRFLTSDTNASEQRRSLGLRSFISPCLSAFRQNTFRSPIISGTGISLLEVYKSLESGMATKSAYQRLAFTDFPRLNKDDVLKILQLLIIASETDFARASCWLEGRPRFVARFVDELLGDSTRTIANFLDLYVTRMTEAPLLDLKSSVSRTPRQALDRLKEPTKALADLAPDIDLRTKVLLGLFFVEYGIKRVIVREGVLLVEFGLAFPSRDSETTSTVVPEPLVLEAGRRSRSLGFLNQRLVNTADDPSASGKQFEYVVADRVVPKLLEWELESSPFFPGGVPEQLKGKWSLAGPSYGRMAEFTGDDGLGFYRWMNRVVKVEEWNRPDPPLGMMFPKVHLGPDIVAVLVKRDRSNQVTGIALMCVQVKLAEHVDGDSAMRTVNPLLFNHTKRDTGKPKPIAKYKKEQDAFVESIEKIPVIRVLMSGCAEVAGGERMSPGSVKRGKTMDVCIVVDETRSDIAALIGTQLAREVKRLKLDDELV